MFRSRLAVSIFPFMLLLAFLSGCDDSDCSGDDCDGERDLVGVSALVVNETTDLVANDFFVFFKNVADPGETTAIAWRVLEDLAPLEADEIIIETETRLLVMATGLTSTTPLIVANGRSYSVTLAAGELVVNDVGAAVAPGEIEVSNDTGTVTIDVDLQKADRTLMTDTVATGNQALFEVRPSVFIGGTSTMIDEGEFLSSMIYDDTNTEISFLGIASTDVVIDGSEGGGYLFSLDNVVLE